MTTRTLSTRPASVRQREWAARHKERLNARSRARYAADPKRIGEAMRNASIKSRFGITAEQYDAMVDEQGGLCAICRSPETVRTRAGAIRRLAIDHDHETDRVRGLLCYRCNTTLGQYELNREAIDAYLGS